MGMGGLGKNQKSNKQGGMFIWHQRVDNLMGSVAVCHKTYNSE